MSIVCGFAQRSWETPSHSVYNGIDVCSGGVKDEGYEADVARACCPVKGWNIVDGSECKVVEERGQ